MKALSAIVVVMLVLTLGIVGCTGPVSSAADFETELVNSGSEEVSISVSVGPTSRALPTDGSIQEVEVDVVVSATNEGVAWCELSDSNSDGTWSGSVDLSAHLGVTYNFRAVVRNGNGDTLYYGESGGVLVTDNSQSVSIVTSAGTYSPIRIDPYVDNNGGVFVFAFSSSSDLYYQLDGTAPADAAALRSSGTLVTPGGEGTNTLSISSLSPGTTHTLYYMGEDVNDASNQTTLLQYDFETTNVTTITASGTTNVSDSWAVAAIRVSDGEPAAIGGTVTTGSPNTWTIEIPEDTGAGYDVYLMFYDPADTANTIDFSSAGSYTVSTTDITGVSLFLDVSVTNIDSTYDGREAEVYVFPTGTTITTSTDTEAYAWTQSIGTVSGEAYFADLLDAATDTSWTGAASTTYDVYLGILTADGSGGPEYLLTDATGSALTTLTTDASGDPGNITVDASGATYNQFPVVYVSNFYHTTPGDLDGREADMYVYSSGADPSAVDPLAKSLGTIGVDQTDYADYPSTDRWDDSGLWFCANGTSYDVYFVVWNSGGSAIEYSVEGSTSGTPVTTFSGGDAMPITVDASGVTFSSFPP